MKALVILALLLVTVSVHAQRVAKELAADCAVDTTGMYDGKNLENSLAAEKLLKSPDKLMQVTGCMDYIRGVIDTWLLWGALNEKSRIELSANYSTVELKDPFMAYLKEHPETTPRPASFVLFAAWREHNMIRFEPATKEEKKP